MRFQIKQLALGISLCCSFLLNSQTVNITASTFESTPNSASDANSNAILNFITVCAELENPVLAFPEGIYNLNSGCSLLIQGT